MNQNSNLNSKIEIEDEEVKKNEESQENEASQNTTLPISTQIPGNNTIKETPQKPATNENNALNQTTNSLPPIVNNIITPQSDTIPQAKDPLGEKTTEPNKVLRASMGQIIDTNPRLQESTVSKNILISHQNFIQPPMQAQVIQNATQIELPEANNNIDPVDNLEIEIYPDNVLNVVMGFSGTSSNSSERTNTGDKYISKQDTNIRRRKKKKKRKRKTGEVIVTRSGKKRRLEDDHNDDNDNDGTVV